VDNDLGGNTRDLITLGKPHPAEQKLSEKDREDAVQRNGQRYRRVGFTLVIAPFIIGLAAALASEGQVFHDPTAQIFAALSMFALITLGAICSSAGINERRNQPLRAMMRQILADDKEDRRRRQAESEACRERQELIIGLVSAVPGRLDEMAEALKKAPTFEDGVELGSELRRAVRGQDHP
jgi:hypothetical protein